MADYILETKDLGISFGGLNAVQNVNIRIKKGQIYGLIGPNGAGKTTIFNLITGVYKPTTGTFFIDGKELKGYVGNIIRTMYTGETKYNGDYILTSDLHGMICKFPYGEPWELYVRH